MGAVFLEENRWITGQWSYQFIVEQQPSIEFLELIAVVAAVVTWNKIEWLNNRRVEVFCDNEAVVHMINNTTSSCPQCHKLIRILTLDCIRANRRLFAHHIVTELNVLADSLSHLNFRWFCRFVPDTMNETPDVISCNVWPAEKIWFTDKIQ